MNLHYRYKNLFATSKQNLLHTDPSWVITWFIVCVLFISHFLFAWQSKQYPQWDEHNYLALAVKYYDLFREPSLNSITSIIHVSGSLQPLYSLSIAAVLGIVGTSHTYFIALLINGLLFALTAFGVNSLITAIFDRKTGILAIIVFGGLGNALFYSHFTYSETAVTFGVIWTLVFLYKSNGFSRKRYALLAGGMFAVATLTRWIAPVFIVGPLLVTLVTGLLQSRTSGKVFHAFLAHTGLFILLAFGLPVFLYFLPNFTVFFDYVNRNQAEAGRWVAQYRFAEMANTFSTRSIMYYFNILSQNTVYIFLFFTLGLVACVTRLKKTAFLLSAFVIPYLFLTFVAVWKEDRFLVSLYPAFAGIVASAVLLFRNKYIYMLSVSALVAISMLIHLATSWGMGPLGYKGLVDFVLPKYIHHPRRIYLTPMVWPPTKEYLNAAELASVIRTHRSGTGKQIVIATYIFEPLDNAFLSISEYHDRHLIDYKKVISADSDFILIKSNDTSSQRTFQSEKLSQLKPIAIIPIPMDNSTVAVYKYEKK